MMPHGDMSFLGPSAEEGSVAHAGSPLENPTGPASEESVIEALKTVHDPEIPVNIYDLGLIYEIDRKDNGDVKLLMTLTAPACPVAGEMPGEVADAVARVEGVGAVEVELTWEPMWNPTMLSDEARLVLDMY